MTYDLEYIAERVKNMDESSNWRIAEKIHHDNKMDLVEYFLKEDKQVRAEAGKLLLSSEIALRNARAKIKYE